MPNLITTPSGLAGEIRGLTGRDGRYLADLKVSRANLIPDYILKSCWGATTNEGIYSIPEGKEPDWAKILIGDRDFTLMQIRSVTYGKLYEFKVHCPNAGCREVFDWEIDLEQLPVKYLSDEDRETYKAGNRFEAKIPETSTGVVFRLVTGGDVQRAAVARKEAKQLAKSKRKEEPNLLIESLITRIVSIEGIEDKNIPRLREKHRAFLEDLPMPAIAATLDMFDSHDCGVETTIAVDCPGCDREQAIQLPFDGDFFFPRKSSRVVGSKAEQKAETEEEEAST